MQARANERGLRWSSSTLYRTCVSLAALALAGCILQDRSCTLIGCWDVVALAGNIPTEARSLAIRVCEGDVCREVELDVPETRDGMDVGACVALESPSTDNVCAESARGSVRRVRAELQLKAPSDTPYSLQVRDRTSNETLLEGAGVPKFTESYPNGKECDETPCRSGTLNFE